jgi:hypothetical protein
MVTAMTAVATPAQAEPPRSSASLCGNGYCDAWADEDAATCPADCATGAARRAWSPSPARPPQILDWNERQGIPPGYHATKTGTGLIIGGAATFGSAWVPSAVLWTFNPRWYLFAVPVVGPILLGTGSLEIDGGGPILTGLLVLDGLQQAVGLGMLVAGLTSRKTILLRNDVATNKPRLFPVPMSFGKGSAGIGLVGEM